MGVSLNSDDDLKPPLGQTGRKAYRKWLKRTYGTTKLVKIKK